MTDVLYLDKDNIVQLVFRRLARVTSMEMLLSMSREDLLSFEYVAVPARTPEKINRLEATLIRSFKGYV